MSIFNIENQGFIIWLTGLSGAGKTTIAYDLQEELLKLGIKAFILDGDNLRQGLCSDLSFSNQDRIENMRRIRELAKLFLDAQIFTICAFISPFKTDREKIKNLIGKSNFIEIYCKCPLEICEKRDPKGHYKKARSGYIKDFTGISSPYEEPEDPEIILQTDKYSQKDCLAKIIDFLKQKNILKF